MIEIVEADIAALQVDAVVNAANSRRVRGGGVVLERRGLAALPRGAP